MMERIWPRNDTALQTRRLRQFLIWLTPAAFAFALVAAVGAVVFTDLSAAIAALILFGYGCILSIAGAFVRRGKRRRAVTMIWSGMLGATLLVLPVQPDWSPSLAIITLLAVAVALPYTSGQALSQVIIVCWLTMVIVAITGEVLPAPSTAPGWFVSVFRVSSLIAATTTVLLLLWQFSSQLRETLAQTTAAEERYMLAAHGANDGLWDWNLQTNAVYFSPRWKGMLGYTEDEIGSKPDDWFALIHPDDRARVKREITTHLEGAEPYFESEHRMLHKGGQVCWMLSRGLAVRDESGAATRMAGSQTDVSERKQAADILERRVAERTHELSTLLDISNSLAASLETRPSLATILDYLQTVIPYRDAAIFLLKGDNFSLVEYRGQMHTDPPVCLHYPAAEIASPRSSEFPGLLPLIVADTRTFSARPDSFHARIATAFKAASPSTRSWMHVPLAVKHNAIGMLSLSHVEPHYFTSRHTTLALAIANQLAIAADNARLYEQAQELAVLRERERLARELHDSVTQSLYSLTLFAEAGRRMAGAGAIERAQEYLTQVGETAQQALAEMRLLVHELRPVSLAQEGLVGTLQRRLEAVEKRAGVEGRLLVDGELDLPEPVAEGLYRITQEALNNSLKHAAATEVQVTIRADAAQVEVDITDNGRGFDPESILARGGMGVLSMHERAEQMGGLLVIRSTPGAGTIVSATVPLHHSVPV